ncbi:MAG: SMC family ATPase [Nanoarchaeota archaeon]
MFLQRLRLQNIRSYIDESISFPEGSTLLSGDIGSGKSTILLAIEFVLFGASRPDLPAESLLRKGAAKGFVELAFLLPGMEITIQRNLKKEKDTVRQMPGHITINNVKKELMPVEMKAEMLSLLGYPEDFLSKNKNYIFRYTVYTPQEEMKLILHEDAEIRLDGLRKIFNIDRYKNIRENVQVYLKKARSDVTALNAKIEPLQEYKMQHRQLLLELEKTERSVQELLPLKTEIRKKFLQQKQELEELELQQKEFVHEQQELKMVLLLAEEQQKRLRQTELKQQQLKEEINQLSLPENLTLEHIQKELQEVEEQKNRYLTSKTVLESRISHFRELIAQKQQQMAELSQEIAGSQENEKTKEKIMQELGKKKELLQQKAEIDELYEKTSSLMIKNKTLLAQSRELQEKISGLENCPTCLQQVSQEHKHQIVSQEDAKVIKAQQLLEELDKKRKEILLKKESGEKNLMEIISQENILLRIDAELQQLHKKKEQLVQKKEQLRLLVQENNAAMQKQQELLQQNNIEELTSQAQQKQKLIRLLSQHFILEKNLAESSRQKEETNLRLLELRRVKEKIEMELCQKNDRSKEIIIKKETFSNLIEEEKDIAVKLAQLQTGQESTKRHCQEVQERIVFLDGEQQKLVRQQELYHWLEEYFLPLTLTIEKQVMIHIHRHFSLLFQEWFSMLIDDENIYAQLDDSFAPCIQQNGYEISFFELSGGEKTSAALAYRLALNKVINDVIHTINTKELLILDEPTDGFSTEQLDKVREVMEKLNLRQTIIVSHESKIESFVENTIKVSKEGHVSSIMS